MRDVFVRPLVKSMARPTHQSREKDSRRDYVEMHYLFRKRSSLEVQAIERQGTEVQERYVRFIYLFHRYFLIK